MRAGRMDRRIRIESPTGGADSFGQTAEAWALFAERWAELVPQGGGERFVAEQRSAEQTVVFRLRYTAGVTPKMSVVWDGRRYDIRDVAEPERRQETVLTCTATEVQAGAGD